MKDNKTAEKQHVKIDIRSVSSGVHSAPLHVLAGNPVPRKDRTPAILAAYRIKSRKIAHLSSINNPLNGRMKKELLLLILVKKERGEYSYRIGKCRSVSKSTILSTEVLVLGNFTMLSVILSVAFLKEIFRCFSIVSRQISN